MSFCSAILLFFKKTKVSLDRIAIFLEEDEVTDQVSTLKKCSSGLPTLDGDDDDGLGIENGSFKWNEVEEKGTKGPDANGVSDGTGAAVGSEIDESDHRFELKDIDIKFPEGQLSLITGPTASGKTALLVCFVAYHIDAADHPFSWHSSEK
jgi:ABC-type multidrug transport system fused ATPase/permease subunit